MVYVINKHGKPLMPTERHDRVRILLKQGLAVPVCNNPFTIKLKYETPNITQPLTLGIDPGRENIGFGVSKENGDCIFLSELKTNNKSVKKNMDDRRAYRRQRRHYKRLSKQRKALRNNTSFKNGEDNTLRSKKPCKSKSISYPGMEKSITCKVIKGAEAQFNNRKKRYDLTPSARQLIQMHLLSIQKIMEFLPISHIIIERNSFDFQKLEDQDIKNWQYSKGPLYGYKDYKDYINKQQHSKCLLCGCDHIDNYHHIIPKSKGGSDTPANIAGLCDNCHNGKNGVHKNPDVVDKLSRLKSGLQQKYKVGLLNTVIPYLIKEINKLCILNGIGFSATDGYETFKMRNEHNFPKRHSIDGYVISISNRDVKNVKLTDCVYIQQRFKKKSAANIQKLNFRGYYVLTDNKEVLVVKNRHKAEGQLDDSLEEYMADYSSTHSEKECEEHLKSLIAKPAKRTYLAHKYGEWSNIHTGDVVKYKKHNKIKGNTKQMVFVATGIKILSDKIEHGTKSKKMKFCKPLSTSCIPYIDKVPI